MDIISQSQEQVNTIAALAFNTLGTRQRDAPPVRLSPNSPEPPSVPSDDAAKFYEQPKLLSSSLIKAAKQFDALAAALPLSDGGEEAQLKRIAELHDENDAVGQELQRQLEAAGLFFFSLLLEFFAIILFLAIIVSRAIFASLFSAFFVHGCEGGIPRCVVI